MATLLQKLLNQLPFRGAAAEQPRVCLGAFGKHPAWNDHIDPDISLEGDLPAIKQLLYLDGVRDRGVARWRAAPAEHLTPFGHILIWQRAHSPIVLVRLWYSRDGLGRDDFPLAVCTEVSGLSVNWVVEVALPLIGALGPKLAGATSRQSVIDLIGEARDRLRAQAAPSAVQTTPFTPAAALLRLAAAPDMDSQGLARVLYVLHDLAGVDSGGASSEQVRVPRCANSPGDAVLLWSGALRAVLGHRPSLLFMAPLEEPWLDIVAGVPDPAAFLSLRASLKSIPLTTQIAYTLEPRFLAHVDELLDRARSSRAMRGTRQTVAP